MKKSTILLLMTSLWFSSCCVDDPLYILGAKGVSSVQDYSDAASIWTYKSDFQFDHIRTIFYKDAAISVINYNDHTAILSHNAETGERYWFQNNLGHYRAKLTGGCIQKDNILVLSDNNFTVAIGLDEGNVLWKAETTYGQTQISLANNKVLKTTNQTGICKVYEIDIFSGKQVKLFHRTYVENGKYEPDYSYPMVYKNERDEDIFILVGGDRHRKSSQILAYNLSTKTTLWNKRYDNENHVVSKVVLKNDKIFFATKTSVRCIDLGGNEVWAQSVDRFLGPNMILENDKLWLSSGLVLDEQTGEERSDFSKNDAWVASSQNYVSWCNSSIFFYDKKGDSSHNYGIGFSGFGCPHPQKELYYTSKGNVLFCLDLDKMK